MKPNKRLTVDADRKPSFLSLALDLLTSPLCLGLLFEVFAIVKFVKKEAQKLDLPPLRAFTILYTMQSLLR